MKTKLERQIFEKMKIKDFGESISNETKRQIFNWVLLQLKETRTKQFKKPRLSHKQLFDGLSKLGKSVNIDEINFKE